MGSPSRTAAAAVGASRRPYAGCFLPAGHDRHVRPASAPLGSRRHNASSSRQASLPLAGVRGRPLVVAPIRLVMSSPQSLVERTPTLWVGPPHQAPEAVSPVC